VLKGEDVSHPTSQKGEEVVVKEELTCQISHPHVLVHELEHGDCDPVDKEDVHRGDSDQLAIPVLQCIPG